MNPRKAGKPRHEPPITMLERAIGTLMATDDYTITGNGDDWAELIYVHNDPPHPVLRIQLLTAARKKEDNS